MERRRPLLGFKSWNYCVFWKLNDDQRFIGSIYCCCGGAETTQKAGEELHFVVSLVLPCSDFLFQHPRTKPCDLLSHLSSSMPSDSRIHMFENAQMIEFVMAQCNNSWEHESIMVRSSMNTSFMKQASKLGQELEGSSIADGPVNFNEIQLKTFALKNNNNL
ncbi:hypothetical protein HHK36_010345 [Tetracentron sinense]|uniref:Transcription factor MYC/MYB N-terminal domain-containing protein n=1 Tax=Tetracentron sinense TaxID=13715 RepID=A0A835DMI9_TETSI|nr:hypothetical protein HHK36_010345 [Tetracentron sinense]